MGHLYISAAHKSSGKTMITLGLARAFADRGIIVQPFKKGPDYIDPKWLGEAAGRTCHNLDFHTQSNSEIMDLFAHHGTGADLNLIEGTKGLHDGVDFAGSDANSALAKLLGAPVVLVINTMGMTRGIAPLLLGYQAFDSDVNIQGIILNMVQGPRHQDKLIKAVEHYTDIPVLGAVSRKADLNIDERHLGLIPSTEHPEALAQISTIAKQINDQIDLDRVLQVANQSPPPATPTAPAAPISSPPPPAKTDAKPKRPDVRIAVARDAAFSFYYADDLKALQQAGARLVYFNALHDVYLPTCDALFLGGGFPETQMAPLSANKTLRKRIKAAIEAGLPAYAECGGLMYLCRSITWHDEHHNMVGIIPGDAVMNKTPQGRGYVELTPTKNHPWPDFHVNTNDTIPAHEFHYSSLENIDQDLTFAFDVNRGHGVTGTNDGIIMHNLVASFSHLRNTDRCPWAQSFTAYIRALKTARGKAQSPAQIAG